jgi:hypothetical protein
MTHTKGPWTIEESGSIKGVKYARNGGRNICKFWNMDTEDEANARLIAAAPSMLEMTARLALIADGIAKGEYPASIYDWEKLAREANAIIAAAEGEVGH